MVVSLASSFATSSRSSCTVLRASATWSTPISAVTKIVQGQSCAAVHVSCSSAAFCRSACTVLWASDILRTPKSAHTQIKTRKPSSSNHVKLCKDHTAPLPPHIARAPCYSLSHVLQPQPPVTGYQWKQRIPKHAVRSMWCEACNVHGRLTSMQRPPVAHAQCYKPPPFVSGYQ